jgi:Tfp pilus assembly protein PilZ
MADEFQDRRRTERIATRTLVEIKVPDWQALQNVYTVNLSQGGMRLAVGKKPPLGTPVDIILTLPNGKRLHLPGQVAHLGPDGAGDVGVRFDELQPHTREEIDRYIGQVVAGQLPRSESATKGIPSGVLIKKD